MTPNATANASSAWVTAVAATSSACLLAGLVVDPGFAFVDFEIDVGTGAAGSEVVIATMAGIVNTLITGSGHPDLLLPIPIDNIATGVRVAVRMRKAGTSVTAWGVAVLYYEQPITGAMTTTAKPPKGLPTSASGAGTTTCTSGTGLWVNGAYAQITASAAADLVLIGVLVMTSTAATKFEIDIAIGAAASEVVVTTIRGYNVSSIEGPNYFPLTPLDAIPSGSRVSCRLRRDDGGNTIARTAFVKIQYLEKPL